MNSMVKKQGGFSLIEIMIALTLGLVIAGGVVQVMVSNGVTERLNRAVASAQESGRFIISRMRAEVLMTGRYDPLSPVFNLDNTDSVTEAAFVQNHPIPLAGDFVADLTLGAEQGADGDNDILVVGMQAERDCRGFRHGYGEAPAPPNEEFYVVNEYYVEGTTLKCRGYDGRVLRGMKVPVAGAAGGYPILDDVESFQVLYGVTNNTVTGNNSGRPVQFVPANELANVIINNGQVVAIRIAILVKGDGEVLIEPSPTFKLLNEAPISPSENRLYKQFETTITLRNVKNFMRNRKI